MRTRLFLKKKPHPHKRTSLLHAIASEINNTVKVDEIYVSDSEGTKKIKKQNKKNIYNFNDKENYSSFLENIKKLGTTEFKKQFPYKRPGGFIPKLGLRDSTNFWFNRCRRVNLLNMSEEELSKIPMSGKIYTRKKMDFFEESTNKTVKIKLFKEDDLPFTKSNIMPEIQWQEIDNDVVTDEEQIKCANKKEIKWLNDTINLIQSDKNYLLSNLSVFEIPFKDIQKKQKQKHRHYIRKKKYASDDSDYIPDTPDSY